MLTSVKQSSTKCPVNIEMQFVYMDLLETGMEGDSFTVVLDKGTLDALASEDNEESRQRAISYFRVSFFRGLCHPGYSLNFN